MNEKNTKKKKKRSAVSVALGVVLTTKRVLVCTYLEDRVDVAEAPRPALRGWVLPQKHTLKAPSPNMSPAHN